MPASRSARAMTFAPRSCPSSPGLATSTRMGRVSAIEHDSFVYNNFWHYSSIKRANRALQRSCPLSDLSARVRLSPGYRQVCQHCLLDLRLHQFIGCVQEVNISAQETRVEQSQEKIIGIHTLVLLAQVQQIESLQGHVSPRVQRCLQAFGALHNQQLWPQVAL